MSFSKPAFVGIPNKNDVCCASRIGSHGLPLSDDRLRAVAKHVRGWLF